MLNIQGVSKTFHAGTVNEVRSLRNVSLNLEAGSFTAIIGTNGSGKSTLLNAIAGVFTPDSGSIKLNQKDVTTWPEYRRARFVGRVFQDPFAGTAQEMSIAENVAIAMKRGQSRGLRPAVTRSLREAVADRVRTLKMGLEDRLDNPIGTLSGGQRQALTLLMATWTRPELLLLDEHTAALDPKSAAKVAQLTSEIIRRENLTALMVTHSMQQAVDMPERIVMMHKGEIIEDYQHERKQRVRVPDLIATFDRVQKRELLDEYVAEVLQQQYV
ncbi:MAG: ABC transporter ATP-binding protein [Thermodesulfobacteriota bacterium]